MHYHNLSFDSLKGKVLKSVTAQDDIITFVTDNNEVYTLYHDQDCCEYVTIDSVVGDVDDLIGNPILLAEEVSNNDAIPGQQTDEYNSFTWTFYKLATIKGYVDIRWYGESNGYYSESVTFSKRE
jgi:hypothetical protein